MSLRSRLLTAALFSAALMPDASAQGRRGFNTRDFLGLGTPPDAAAAERGEKLYAPNCAFCHGARANGGEAPDLVRSALVLHDEKGELIGPVVQKGRPDKGMPAFASFTPAQLYDIAEFLHMKVELAANRGLYKVLNVVTGDPKKGQVYFEAHCSNCHSPTGDLAHIAAKFAPADLQAQFLYPGSSFRFDGASRGPQAPKVTVTLPSGQVVTGRLKKMDDFNVSLYDDNGDYHSWPREKVKVEVEDKAAPHKELLPHYTDADIHNVLAYLVTLK